MFLFTDLRNQSQIPDILLHRVTVKTGQLIVALATALCKVLSFVCRQNVMLPTEQGNGRYSLYCSVQADFTCDNRQGQENNEAAELKNIV